MVCGVVSLRWRWEVYGEEATSGRREHERLHKKFSFGSDDVEADLSVALFIPRNSWFFLLIFPKTISCVYLHFFMEQT